jgi:hypothetical protein
MNSNVSISCVHINILTHDVNIIDLRVAITTCECAALKSLLLKGPKYIFACISQSINLTRK